MNKELTPVFRQYTQQKSEHKDSVLFFRMGDFYEMFYTDAVEVSRLLNITLTQRQGIPMCGVPHHAAGNYIKRLLQLGKKVALCEQISLPSDGRGIAQREVVEVVTPGTVVDDAYLDESVNNYLVGIAGKATEPAFAYIDLSTGEFRITILKSGYIKDSLRCELAKTSPREIVIQQSLLESDAFSFLLESDLLLNRIPDWSMDSVSAEERLKRQFGTVNLKAFGLEAPDPRILAASIILEYLEDNRKNLIPHLDNLICYDEGKTLGLDESTIRNLEIVSNFRDGGRSYTLLESLDHTKTSAGVRLLRKKLLNPFRSVETVSGMHNRVEILYHDQSILLELRIILGGMQDLERLSARTAMDRAHAKDIVAIRNTLAKFLEIYQLVPLNLWDVLETDLENLIQEARELVCYLGEALLDDPSILLNEGRLIREGWDAEIDRMRMIECEGKSLLESYIAEERVATGLSSLKLRYNRILGYFMEVSKSQAVSLPEKFRRRQSLSQVERFSTNRLEDIETEISSVGEQLIEREREVFLEIRNHVKIRIRHLQKMARMVADLDLVQSYAHVATEYGYIRPRMVGESITNIRGGRHPVVEQHLPQGAFIPNSIHLSSEDISFALVTGPNMAGKSTVLRQVALITLMAQVGSFVPADEATIGMADKIFCRVGASDNIARGESTFLVEMNETANILRNATSKSLVIMDEVGRGTGTADGLAIARAVCEYLLEHQSPRTLFATHYRELVTMEYKNLSNFSMSVEEVGDEIVFPKKLVPGAAEASYGIHVAALAGLPEQALQRARILLQKDSVDEQQKDYLPKEEFKITQGMLFDPRDIILETLISLDLGNMKPATALKVLQEWQKELGKSD